MMRKENMKPTIHIFTSTTMDITFSPKDWKKYQEPLFHLLSTERLHFEVFKKEGIIHCQFVTTPEVTKRVEDLLNPDG